MNMRRHIAQIALAAALVAALALPATAPAEYYVPPDNSAANQYTESFPGAGGESGGKRKHVSPGDTLGARNADRLEKHGAAGKAAAEVAAQTAPAQLATDSGPTGSTGGNGQSAGGAGQSAGSAGDGSGPTGTETGGSTAGSGSTGGSTASGSGGTVGQAAKVEQPQGSSGFGEVLGQATGTSDGNLGIWLPLALVLMLLGSIAYGARARQARHGHSA
jgi:hypothetical protein